MRLERKMKKMTHLASSPGLIAITLPSITAIAPRVAAATKSLCTFTKNNVSKLDKNLSKGKTNPYNKSNGFIKHC